jgi:hypothetical protein
MGHPAAPFQNAGVPKGIHQGSFANSEPLIHDSNRYTSN